MIAAIAGQFDGEFRCACLTRASQVRSVLGTLAESSSQRAESIVGSAPMGDGQADSAQRRATTLDADAGANLPRSQITQMRAWGPTTKTSRNTRYLR